MDYNVVVFFCYADEQWPVYACASIIKSKYTEAKSSLGANAFELHSKTEFHWQTDNAFDYVLFAVYVSS